MTLEKDLLQEEQNSLSTKLQSVHTDRQKLLDDAATKLAERLQGEVELKKLSYQLIQF